MMLDACGWAHKVTDEEWFGFPQANVTLAQAEAVEQSGEQKKLF